MLDKVNDPRLDPRTAALILIDLENDVLCDGHGVRLPWATPVVKRAADAVAWARQVDIPVVWVWVERRADYADVFAPTTDQGLAGKAPTRKRLIAGEAGSRLAEELSVEPGDYTVVKRRVNAFYGTPLEIYLRRLGATTLLFGGVYTNMGVEATVRAAYDRDFHSIVISDLCASYGRAEHEHSLQAIFPRLARVRSLGETQRLVEPS